MWRLVPLCRHNSRLPDRRCRHTHLPAVHADTLHFVGECAGRGISVAVAHVDFLQSGGTAMVNEQQVPERCKLRGMLCAAHLLWHRCLGSDC
jgi:hypothetical protein